MELKHFKEGFITEAEFEQEMRLLGYTSDQIQHFLVLARTYFDRERRRKVGKIAS
ncbi:MAG: hypothetical protein JRD89_13955 [Deltaproteobacteria bacterium]|nr:hypothetical protein [Deltaproteobacteria bacterium]